MTTRERGTKDYISDEYLERVINYFRKEAEKLQLRQFKKTINEIGESLGVSALTVTRAINQLEEKGIITVIRAKSRRFPNTYIYNGSSNIEEDSKEKRLKNIIKALERENERLKKQVKTLQSIINYKS